ncbi:MAG: bifunctional metallophosphatase/5'-nucleotidase [Flavobacteriales bacterium]|nr:MAG: bifunctional metallophosphatase/5'-nucleotidase [Flavobacteriales bacterium]
MKYQSLLTVIIIFTLFGCKENTSKNEITFKFIQINDVYEIAPLGGGIFGGMARVAHVRDSIKKENPNTFLFMAGDFLSPSLLGTIKVDGEYIYGKQMIEVMNAMEFDLVTFGNHEFDLKEKDLQKRLNESSFPWMSSNVRQLKNDSISFFKIQRPKDTLATNDTFTMIVNGKNDKKIKIGFLGVTLPYTIKDYVFYGNIYNEAERAYDELKNKVDLVFGLTHLELGQDKEFLERIPQIPLVMGGHEHYAMSVTVGNSKITKADANAKTIYIHTLVYNTVNKDLKIDSELFSINDKITSKPEIENIVNKWENILNLKIKEIIDEPSEVIFKSPEPLDGTEISSRSIQTNLGAIITQSMIWSFNDEVDAALVNGGSIRVDDMLPSDLSSIDIFRTLPFGGGILKVDLEGVLLKEVLDYGNSKKGTGAYLQRHNLEKATNGEWLIQGEKIILDKTYKIAFSDFLLKGFDIPFLNPNNKHVKNIYRPNKEEKAYDIRKATILYLKSLSK